MMVRMKDGRTMRFFVAEVARLYASLYGGEVVVVEG